MTDIPEDAGYDAPSPSSAAPTYSYSRDSADDSSGSGDNTVMWAVIIAIGAGVALLSWLFKGGSGGGDGGGGDGSGGLGVVGPPALPIVQLAVVVQSPVRVLLVVPALAAADHRAAAPAAAGS